MQFCKSVVKEVSKVIKIIIATLIQLLFAVCLEFIYLLCVTPTSYQTSVVTTFCAAPSTNNNGASSIDQEELGNTSNWETSGKKCTNAISVLNELAQTRNLDIDYTAQSTGPDHKRR